MAPNPHRGGGVGGGGGGGGEGGGDGGGGEHCSRTVESVSGPKLLGVKILVNLGMSVNCEVELHGTGPGQGPFGPFTGATLRVPGWAA